MRVLVTGAAGFLGVGLVEAAPRGVEVHGTWRTTRPPGGCEAHRVELSDRAAVARLLHRVHPDVVVHTAFSTADLGRDVVDATAAVADAAASGGAALVHLSSDVVFSGEAAPYAEHDPPSPVSAYGRAKAAAEAEVEVAVPDAAIVRTSLVLTPATLDPRTRFVADALAAGRSVDLFVDEIRTPLLRDDLVTGLWRLVGRGRARRSGPWHLVGPRPMNRYELGQLVCRRVGGDPSLLRSVPSPRDTDDPRPRDLRLLADRTIAELDWSPRDVAVGYEPAASYPRAVHVEDAE